MKEAIIAFLVALVVGAGVNQFLAGQSTAATPDQPAAQRTDDTNADMASALASLPDSGESTFAADVLQSKDPVVVDWYATWCEPCKRMVPVLGALATKYDHRVKFVRIDIDKNQALANKYGVSSLPNIMIFKGGQKGESFEGTVPQDALEKSIDKTL